MEFIKKKFIIMVLTFTYNQYIPDIRSHAYRIPKVHSVHRIDIF